MTEEWKNGILEEWLKTLTTKSGNWKARKGAYKETGGEKTAHELTNS